jgi:TRAP-type C4-dicarboxylate transport system substrate-binding protein
MLKKKFDLQVLWVFCLGITMTLVPFAMAQAKDDVIELKMANLYPPPAEQSKICEEFIKDLETRSEGRITVKYYPGGSLVKAPQIYDAIKSGLIDMGYTHIFYTPGRMAVTEAGGLPLGFTSPWTSSYALNDFYFQLQPKEWDEVKVLWLNGLGPGIILTNKPVRTMEDLKGLTLRAPGISGDIIKAWGGTPAPTPMPEVYDAIKKGVIDGTTASLETLKTWRFAEVTKYVTLTWQVGFLYPFYMAMNKNSYNKLPPDLKAILDGLCGEYRGKYALMWNEIELKGKQFGESKGLEFIELSEAEAARWQQAVEPVIDDYVKKMVEKGFPESEVRGWISLLRERNEYYTKKQIEYFIPSASGPGAMRLENIGK